jgi:hypothetical protein
MISIGVTVEAGVGAVLSSILILDLVSEVAR